MIDCLFENITFLFFPLTLYIIYVAYVKNIDIIDLDVIRTSFDINEEINRGKISNMLKAISKELPSLNYCQGMNQIAQFLLDVCDYDEEEAFFVFLSLSSFKTILFFFSESSLL